MTDAFTPLLSNLPLSKTERESVKRFSEDPAGRGFLPVADILRAYRFVDESLELLTQGVENHPQFTVARVILVRELLSKGLVGEAWQVLDQSAESLRDNVLAQKLRLKLTILLSDEPAAKATNQHLKLQQMHDLETKKLGEILDISGLAAAKAKLVKDFADRGTELVVPAVQPQVAAAVSMAPDSVTPTAVAPKMSSVLGESSAYLKSDAFKDDTTLAGFHVVMLNEIFSPGDSIGEKIDGSGIELDSTTLAEIYIRQHHYGKALEIYRRLLRMTPGSDLLRNKVSELVKLDREQKDTDLSVDPVIVDRMESLEIVDRQMRFLNNLLSRLT